MKTQALSSGKSLWPGLPSPMPTPTQTPNLTPVDQVHLTASPEQPPSSPVEARFREVFFSDYEARKCGQNIRRFVTRFPQPEELRGAKVLGIENKGFSYFGMVRAMHTRDEDFRGQLRVTDSNWYHHVILEKDGRIYDFDYGITPQAPTVAEYFDKMFLQCDKVRPEEKLKDYQIQVIDAQEYAEARRDTSTTKSLKEYLEGWGLQRARYTPRKAG